VYGVGNYPSPGGPSPAGGPSRGGVNYNVAAPEDANPPGSLPPGGLGGPSGRVGYPGSSSSYLPGRVLHYALRIGTKDIQDTNIPSNSIATHANKYPISLHFERMEQILWYVLTLGFISSLGFELIGVWNILTGTFGRTDLDLFGMTIQSKAVGVTAVIIGVLIPFLVWVTVKAIGIYIVLTASDFQRGLESTGTATSPVTQPSETLGSPPAS
jgi:hypothetical protein